MKHQVGLPPGLLLGWVIVSIGMPSVGEAQTTTRVSVASGGGQGNAESGGPVVSDDGRIVLFTSDATNLVPGDTNGVADVFVHDRQTGTTTRVSVATGGAQANEVSGEGIAMSTDGRIIAFDSYATNLVVGDTNGEQDVFIHDRQTGTTTRVSVATGGIQGNNGSFPALSADGRFVAFVSEASNLVSGDTNGSQDVFVHDRQTGTTERVSVGPGGLQADLGSGDELSLSGDGRFVAFISEATNLVPGDTNGVEDAFVHDRQTGTTERVSVGTGGIQANGESDDGPALSGDGRFVAFISEATNLVSGDTNGVADIFVHDRQTGTTTRVSVATGGQQANAESESMALSGNGRFVAIDTEATNLVTNSPTHGGSDVYVHDRQTGTTILVSIATNGALGNGGSETVKLSGNGRFVVFESHATTFVPGDTNGVQDVFIHDRGPAAVGNPGGADLDGDGKVDIVWRNTINGITAIWLLNGTTLASSSFPGGVSLAWQVAGVGDVNGDGLADVIWRNGTTGTVAVWLMNGLTITSVGFPGSTPTDWDIQAIGDINGDGNADLLWRNTSDGNTAIWFMNGAVIASSSFPGGVSLTWQIAGVGDVNGDGKADVIWRNTANGTVAVWVMAGPSIVSFGFPGSAPLDWVIAGIGDIDGNGTADLVWNNPASAMVAGWLMNGAAIGSSGFLGGKTAVWEIAQVGDADGNGQADLIWFNTSTGGVEIWLMNALAISSTGSPGTTSPSWEIQSGAGPRGQSPPSPLLTINKVGTGSGIVTSTPPGINCGAGCSASFAQGTSITLRATPVAGSTFGGWSGGGCTGTAACTVTLIQALTVTANFTVTATPSVTDISGKWFFQESVTAICSLAGEQETLRESASGMVTINQNGQQVSFIPTGLPSDFIRTGLITGNSVEFSGKFIAPLEGIEINFTQNIATANGPITSNRIDLIGTGIARGTVEDFGQLECTGNSTATLTR